MSFKEDIERLIPEPGCFIVFEEEDNQSSPKTESRKIKVKKEAKWGKTNIKAQRSDFYIWILSFI